MFCAHMCAWLSESVQIHIMSFYKEKSSPLCEFYNCVLCFEGARPLSEVLSASSRIVLIKTVPQLLQDLCNIH